MAMSTLGVLLKMIVARSSLKLATEKALEAMAMNPYPRAYEVAEITGLPGFGTLLGCLGLGMAFLALACGIAMASAGAVFIAKKQVGPFLETAFIGLTISMGCGMGGALLGSTLLAVLTLGPRGLLFMGLILSLSLSILVALQKDTIAGLSPTTTLLCFLTLTFLTMLLGVWLGMIVAGYDMGDLGETVVNSFFLVVLLSLPGGYIVDTLAVMTIRRQLYFGLLVTVTGFLLGFGMGGESTAFFTLPTVVYIIEILTGVVGASLGAMSVQYLAADTTEGLSMWISLPAVVVLYNLHMDVPKTGLHGLIEWYLGVGGELGLMLGLTGASGFALGSTVKMTRDNVWFYAILVFGIECGILYNDWLSFRNFVLSMALILGPMLTGNSAFRRKRTNTIMLLNDALNLASLGAVLMGAMLLGVGGLLTAGLGSAGLYGIAGAVYVIVLATVYVIVLATGAAILL